MTLNRRSLIRLGGLTAAASLFPSIARAGGSPGPGGGDEAPPRRIVFVYAEGGWTPRQIFMRPPGAPAAWSAYDPWHRDSQLVRDDQEWEFDLADPALAQRDFSRVLQPFFRHRAKMTVLEGLAMLSTSFDPHGDAHAQGHLACMSALPAASGEGVQSHGSGPSLDQRISEYLQQSDPAHFSLDFRPTPGRVDPSLFHEFLYQSNGRGGADVLRTESNPEAAYRRLFPEVAAPQPRDLGRRHVLGLVRERFRALESRVGGEDRARLQQHRDLVERLESRLGHMPSCGAQPSPTSVAGMSRGEQYETDFLSFADLVTAALACGQSRVASIGITQVPPESYGLPAGASIHHEYEHPSDPFRLSWEFDGNPPESYGSAIEGMVRRNIYQAELVAELVDRLDSVPEGDGTMLDNTVVVYVSELSHGGHGHEHWPVIMFGGLGGAIRAGRYIKYAQNNPNPYNRNYYNEWTGVPHSRLFVSLCRAFGMDIDHLHARSAPGVVPHLGISGTVDFSGPLPRLG